MEQAELQAEVREAIERARKARADAELLRQQAKQIRDTAARIARVERPKRHGRC